MQHRPSAGNPMSAYTMPSEISSRLIIVETFSGSSCGGASATWMNPSRPFLLSQSLVAVESAIGSIYSSSILLLQVGAWALLIACVLPETCVLYCALKSFHLRNETPSFVQVFWAPHFSPSPLHDSRACTSCIIIA